MKKKYTTPYNPKWPKYFQEEAQQLQEALTLKSLDYGKKNTERSNNTEQSESKLYLQIEHVGSTSVPGLTAKPVIDILIVTPDLLHTKKLLEAAGYRFKGEFNVPYKFFFDRKIPRDIHIHVMKERHPEIAVQLAFRDTLRAHDDLRDRYANLKLQLIKSGFENDRSTGMFSKYTTGKNALIKEILVKSGLKQTSILRAAHEDEWTAVKHLQQQAHTTSSTASNPIANEKLGTFVLYHEFEIYGYGVLDLDKSLIIETFVKDHPLAQSFREKLQTFLNQYARFRKENPF